MTRAELVELALERRHSSRTTLFFCTLLHAFTHAYGTLLVPLYLLIRDDLGLKYASQASFLVLLYGVVFCLGSFPAGILADRFDRKLLLGLGLFGHAVSVLAMGLVRDYAMLVALSVSAGVFATFFHPVANALATAHFPRSPGMAIGILGMGAGLGFFAGPQYAGWRAQTATWHFASVADWQRPLVEMGLAGLITGVLFMLLAREAPDRPARRDKSLVHPPLGKKLRWRVIAVSLVLMSRDFAGVASLSLVSIYLLSAQGLDVQRTGFILGAMMLVSVGVNPIMVYFSPGKRRLPFMAAILVLGGLVISTVPYWHVDLVLPVMCIFQAFQLGSYAVSDAAILERVPAAVRGRVVGLFLTIAGTFASTSPWVIVAWTDMLKSRAYEPSAYWPLFIAMGVLMVLSAFSTPLIARLGAPDETAIEPAMEIKPKTMEPVG